MRRRRRRADRLVKIAYLSSRKRERERERERKRERERGDSVSYIITYKSHKIMHDS